MKNSRFNTIIIDDEQDARDALRILLAKYSFIEITNEFESANPAIEFISSNEPDLIFLDIDMPGKNGFEFIDELKDLHLKPTIIFTTAYPQYAIEAIEEAAFGYLLKPIDPEKLRKVLNRYRCETTQMPNQAGCNKIKFNTRNGFELLDTQNIVYLLAEGSYTEVYTNNSQTLMVSQNLGSIEARLDSNHFHRISRSCLVNVSYLKKVNRSTHTCTIRLNGKEVELKSTVSRIAGLEKLFG